MAFARNTINFYWPLRIASGQLGVFAALCTLLFACTEPAAQDSGEKPEQPTAVDTLSGPEGLPDINQQILDNPTDGDLYLKRGKHLFQEGLLADALADADRALVVDSTNADYLYFKGQVLLKQLQTRDARTVLDKAIEINPKHVDAHLLLGEIYLLLRMHDESIQSINNALRVEVRNKRGYFLKGLNYIDLGDTATALTSLLTAIEQDPEYYEAYMLCGNLLAAKHDALADGYYTNALSLRNTSIEALYGRALFRQEHGLVDRAVVDYLAILHLDSTNYNAWFNLGYSHLVHLKDYQNAIQYYEQATLIDPESPEAFYNLGYAYELNGDFPNSEAAYRKSLELDPQYDLPAKGISRIVDGVYEE